MKLSTADEVKEKLDGTAGPVRLNLGCGDKIIPGYVNVDIVDSRLGKVPDLFADVTKLEAFPSGCADEILTVHVVEHLNRWEVVDVLMEWKRLLKPGGTLITECPNLLEACKLIVEDPKTALAADQRAQRTMWVLYGDPAHKDPLMGHRWNYTPESLAVVLMKAGFAKIQRHPAQFKLKDPRDMRIVALKVADAEIGTTAPAEPVA